MCGTLSMRNKVPVCSCFTPGTLLLTAVTHAHVYFYGEVSEDVAATVYASDDHTLAPGVLLQGDDLSSASPGRRPFLPGARGKLHQNSHDGQLHNTDAGLSHKAMEKSTVQPLSLVFSSHTLFLSHFPSLSFSQSRTPSLSLFLVCGTHVISPSSLTFSVSLRVLDPMHE